MADSFSLPLRPLIEKRDRPDTLPLEIAQINARWGSFRDVNEDTLRAKIEEDKNRDPYSDDDEAEKAAEDVDSTERMEQLYKRRAEIQQFAMQAHMETLFALDFVSLLLSKHTPRQAETSMSTFLKQVAPLGSLNSEIVNPPPKPDAVGQDIKAVSRGWRLQNFNAAANKLLKSATRLETEVASESKYWEEVLAVKEKGWKVCRLPRDRQALGVQYGFMEATPIFRDRGLAALRRADDGSLILDKGLAPQKTRTVRVRVKHHDRFTGCSKVRSSPEVDSIESRILQARDTVYEEELFHELVREARILGSQRVTTRQNLVRFPISEEQEVLLDLVDADQDASADDSMESTEHDALADALSHSIRILLAYAHRQNLRRRTQPPPPLSQKRRHTPEYHLLRPIMAYLQHSSHVRSMETFLTDIYRVQKAAGLTCDFHAAPFSSVKLSRMHPSLPKVEGLVQQFLMPFESTFSGTLATPQSSFKVRIRTNPVAPPFGTLYDISVNLPHYPHVQPPSRIGLQKEAADVLTHFAMLEIVAAIQAHGSKLAKDSPKKDVTAPLTWEAAYPHHGELLALSSAGQNKKLKISLSQKELTVEAYSMRGLDGFARSAGAQSPKLRSQTWVPDQAGPVASLMDFVTEVSRDQS
ncbi:hypothetical protein BO70DRAFT_290315 [Aspergillus heteromorphus CBS 117.55]|uniref:Mediator of RNA polymerase II transcription subunit 17 n=1 Tax=Aspergillus heteromorphus CBS 117.55 TaxID=1448321 RepID=A0A317WGM6_9EURO|nr:uncharacterized protein BO70DRAFT_290315 [Aspergillus heteromorphus CBS 117.55]PWY84821.1 hypothetical protein BO70DRAFT_290315 [Aspergillus heteromorphus CBS 117.55]